MRVYTDVACAQISTTHTDDCTILAGSFVVQHFSLVYIKASEIPARVKIYRTRIHPCVLYIPHLVSDYYSVRYRLVFYLGYMASEKSRFYCMADLTSS